MRAFYHSGTRFEKELLREHYADMIFKNVQSLLDLPMDSRQMAVERSLMRKSLRGLSFEQMQAKSLDSVYSTVDVIKPEDNYQLQGNGVVATSLPRNGGADNSVLL